PAVRAARVSRPAGGAPRRVAGRMGPRGRPPGPAARQVLAGGFPVDYPRWTEAQVKAAGSRLAWLPDARPAGSGRGRSEGWIPLVIYVDRGPLLEGCRLAARLLPARTPDPAGPHLLRARGSGYTLHAVGRPAGP